MEASPSRVFYRSLSSRCSLMFYLLSKLLLLAFPERQQNSATAYLLPLSAHPHCINSNSSCECADTFAILIWLHIRLFVYCGWRHSTREVSVCSGHGGVDTASREYNLCYLCIAWIAIPTHSALDDNMNDCTFVFYLFVLHISWICNWNILVAVNYLGPVLYFYADEGGALLLHVCLCTILIIFHS